MIPLIIVITGRKMLIITIETQKVNICCNSLSFSFFNLPKFWKGRKLICNQITNIILLQCSVERKYTSQLLTYACTTVDRCLEFKGNASYLRHFSEESNKS